MDFKTRRSLIAGCSAAAAHFAAAVAIGAAGPDDPPAGFSTYVAKDGAISRPTDYREKFEHIGTYSTFGKQWSGGDRKSDFRKSGPGRESRG